jgi:hypothetical protein
VTLSGQIVLGLVAGIATSLSSANAPVAHEEWALKH